MRLILFSWLHWMKTNCFSKSDSLQETDVSITRQVQLLIPRFWGEIPISLQGKQHKPSVSKDSGLRLVNLRLFPILLVLGPFYWQNFGNKLAQCLRERKTRRRKTTFCRSYLNHYYMARYVQFCVWVCQYCILISEDSAEKNGSFSGGRGLLW